jgi:FAD dependent oxidoreductase
VLFVRLKSKVVHLTPGGSAIGCMIAVALAISGIANAQTIRIVDPLAVQADGDSSRAVVTLSIPKTVQEKNCDIVILGGGLGGSAATLTASQNAVHVCMTEPTNWLGGQMTSQGISAFDDNEWTETTGATRSFQELRRKIREHYAPMLREGVKPDSTLNPGLCWVSYECSEASVDLAVLRSMLEPYAKSGKLEIFLRTAPIAVDKRGDSIRRVTVYSFETRKFFRLAGKIFIDATELGEFLPMTGAEYGTGAESRSETGERDAPEKANPHAAQSFTYAFVLNQGGSKAVSAKPTDYDRYRSHFSFQATDADGTTLSYGMYVHLPKTPGSFWSYRRLIAKEQFKPGAFPSDLSMINWDSNDVCDERLLSANADEEAAALQHGKQVSLAFAWWLQHDVPRDDRKGTGYPEVAIVQDALGSADGLSQFPYVREARRMKALQTIHEQDLATSGARAVPFDDSVGIGQYPIDIHACGASPHLPPSKPYQIPLGALLSVNVENLLAASKNIGTTHITNGAYRVHPTEWAIGSAAGFVAAAAIKQRVRPREIEGSRTRLRELQGELIREGQPLVWFDDVALDSPHFESAQFAAVLGLIELRSDSLKFVPEEQITGKEAAMALERLAVLTNTPTVPNQDAVAAERSLQWRSLAGHGHGAEKRSGPVKRGEFADWLISIYHPPQDRE